MRHTFSYFSYFQLLKAKQVSNKRAESRAEFESRLKAEMQEILSAKMQRLLDRQTEATQVTADAARTLAQLQMNKRQIEPTSSAAEPIPLAELAKALRRAADRKVVATSDESAASRTSKITNAEREREATSTRSAASGAGSASGPVSRELRSLISRTESRVPEVLSAIEHTEASGGSVPRSIAEMIDNLSAEEASASHNITEDIATELTGERADTAVTASGSREAYTSKFEDAEPEDEDSSTVKEVSSAATAASISDKIDPNSDKLGRGGEAEEQGYESTSESRLLAPSTSTLSLFSDGDSFNKFTLQMFRQHLEEESVRARHQYDLLKRKEASLIEKARRELETLQERKNAAGATEEERQRAKRRAKSVLAELKSRRAEINQLKKSLKVAEKERAMIKSQQERMLAERGAAVGEESSSTSSSREDGGGQSARSRSTERSPERSQATRDTLRSAEHQILHGLRKMQRNKRLLGELGPEFLEKSRDLERLLKQSKSRSADSASESSSVQEEVKSESERTSTTTTTTAPTSPSKMQNLKKTMGATLKTPLSPKGASGGGGGAGGRKRHSSADSDDSQSVSHSETVSDHSDVEIRINALQDELRRRMMTAAKLKKQQRAKSKEKLRMKEETLKRQIEKYDKLIQETVAELEEEQVVVQPQIKTPYKAAAVSPAAPASTPVAARKASESPGSEGARAKSSPDLSEAGDGAGGEDNGSGQLASLDSSVAFETVISKEAEIAEEGHLTVEIGEVKASAVAKTSPTKLTPDKASEGDDDAVQSDLNYSDDFTSSNGSGAEAPEPPATKVVGLLKVVPSIAALQTPTPMTSECSTEVSEDVTNRKKAEERKLEQADRIAAGILDHLLAETIDICVSVPKPRQDRIPSKAAAKTSLSPRSRPQDLMLSTFDISSESSDEGECVTHFSQSAIHSAASFTDRKLSPKRCQKVDVDLENEESAGDFEGNYIDDDVYGLSIKKESEELRQQELLIEQEVKHFLATKC